MADLNKVFLIGNLTRDPELRQINERASVAKLGLAINRRFTTRSGEDREETCFVDVDVWGRQAEACSQYLRKGAPAFVEGRLALDQWEDQSGQKRSRHYIRAERVQFLGSPSRDAGFQEQGDSRGGGREDDGHDRQGPSQQPPPSPPSPPAEPQTSMPKFEENGGSPVEDDIPF